MHFSIPDTTEFLHTASRTSFTGFNVHINGCLHACLRYKQLHSLHEQLKNTFPNLQLPTFPSKRLFLLNPAQLEERRSALERYIQLIGQDPVFSKSELLRTFLLAAQKESAYDNATTTKDVEDEGVTFDVYLMNGQKIPVKCLATDCSGRVLELVCMAMGLPRELTYHFALFLLAKDAQGNVDVRRKMMDFEAPVLTLKNVQEGDCKCVIRKSYWDHVYDQEVMNDPVGLNLLYAQSVADNENWTLAVVGDSLAKEDILSEYQRRGCKREYVEWCAKNLPNYGTLQFTNCVVDHPEKDTEATVMIGNKEINFRTPTEDPNTIQETKFRVTRIRCWKITTTQANPLEKPVLELSFEFLMTKNYLKWIQIRSEKAMMMTVCLQSLVSELLNQKSDSNNLRTISNVTKPGFPIAFLPRDETNQFRKQGVPLTKIHQAPAADVVDSSGAEERTERRVRNTEAVKQKLREISTTVFFKNGQNRVHNEAFEGIGDEDL